MRGQPAEDAADRGSDEPFEDHGCEDALPRCANHAQEGEIAFSVSRHSQQRDEDRETSGQRKQPGKDPQTVEARADEIRSRRAVSTGTAACISVCRLIIDGIRIAPDALR